MPSLITSPFPGDITSYNLKHKSHHLSNQATVVYQGDSKQVRRKREMNITFQLLLLQNRPGSFPRKVEIYLKRSRGMREESKWRKAVTSSLPLTHDIFSLG
ncbi:unnamed protein product [Rangifer tarandus platyrhynchus]|uniref:Uncharacterized protein n=1 Tax=Rangifer tarandus platyrhynchus TaxID=3082113 RepID=A0AC60A6J5_RANTA